MAPCFKKLKEISK